MDLAKKETGGLLGRLNHPVFGVIIGSWLVINWELVYTLVRGEVTVSQTIKTINEVYLVSGRWPSLILWPVIFGVCYLVLGPILADLYEIGILWANAKINKLRPIALFEYEGLQNQYKQVAKDLIHFQTGYYLATHFELAKIDIPLPNGDKRQGNYQEVKSVLLDYANKIKVLEETAVIFSDQAREQNVAIQTLGERNHLLTMRLLEAGLEPEKIGL